MSVSSIRGSVPGDRAEYRAAQRNVRICTSSTATCAVATSATVRALDRTACTTSRPSPSSRSVLTRFQPGRPRPGVVEPVPAGGHGPRAARARRRTRTGWSGPGTPVRLASCPMVNISPLVLMQTTVHLPAAGSSSRLSGATPGRPTVGGGDAPGTARTIGSLRTASFWWRRPGVRAVVIREFGPPGVLEPAEVAEVRAGPDEVVIDVEFANVTFVETQVRAGRPPHPSMLPVLPAILGNGVGGTVGDASPWSRPAGGGQPERQGRIRRARGRHRVRADQGPGRAGHAGRRRAADRRPDGARPGGSRGA